MGGNPLLFSDFYGLANDDHSTGQWKQCTKGCRFRIDFTLENGVKKRHLHWECRNKEGVGGEFGGVSHGETLEDAPENVKECARKAKFEPEYCPAEGKTGDSILNKGLGVIAVGGGLLACAIAEPCGAILSGLAAAGGGTLILSQ